MEISADRVVLIHYTLKDDAGAVMDSSAGGEPLAYIQGHGNLVSGLEKALEGKHDGDSVAVSVAPADGYYKFNINPFRNYLWTGKLEYKANKDLTLGAEPYFWYELNYNCSPCPSLSTGVNAC